MSETSEWASMRCSDGRHQYKHVDGAWVIDEVGERAEVAYQERRRNLATALVSRVLTTEEMVSVLNLGTSLFIRSGVCYFERDVERQFQAGLLQQFKLKLLAEESAARLKNV